MKPMIKQMFALTFVVLPYLSVHADDWPQWLGPKRDGVWRESGIVREFNADGPEITWRTKVAGGYSGPAIADGRVFLTDYVVSDGITSPNPDVRNDVQGSERVHCFDEQTAHELWRHTYPRSYKISFPTGPRATPTVDGDRVYVLGAEGDLLCLQTGHGDVVWSRNLRDDYKTETPIWGYTAHPLVVGDKLFCLAGGKGSAVVALNKMTGEEIWKSLTTPDIGYSPPTLIEAGGKSQLLIWHSKSLNSVDPSSGELFWSHQLEPDYGMSIAPPRKAGDLLFVGAIKNKSMALRLDANKPDAGVIWRGNKKVGIGPSHSPIAVDPNSPEFIYGVDRGGQLRCVRLSTGEQIWETYALVASKRFSNSGTGFITPNHDRYFIFGETAELIIAKLSPEGYQEISRSKPLLKTTHHAIGRAVVWSPPAFANGAMFVRNDEELIRVSLKR